MKSRVYIETSVLSYLTSRPSSDVVIAGRQKVTRDWWAFALDSFDLVVSELVHREANAGDPAAIRSRTRAIEELPTLAIDAQAEEFAGVLIARGALPASEPEDALHIALVVVNGIEFLVTWNFKHIANAALRSRIEQVCVEAGFDPCTICTPEELWEPRNDA